MAVLKEMISGSTPASAISSISSSASFHWFFLASAAMTVLYDTVSGFTPERGCISWSSSCARSHSPARPQASTAMV